MPSYVIKMAQSGYYDENQRWVTVPLNEATRLPRGRAESICKALQDCGYDAAFVEEIFAPSYLTNQNHSA